MSDDYYSRYDGSRERLCTRITGGKYLLAPVEWMCSLWCAVIRYVHEIRHLNVLSKGMDGRGLTKKLQLRVLPYAAYGCAVPIAIYYRQYFRLADFLCQSNHPELRAAETADPQIRFKMFLPYRCSGLSVAQRVDAQINHYLLARSLFGERLFRKVHVDIQGFVLCQVNLPGEHGNLLVRLTRFFRSWREGELSMALYEPSGNKLYTLTFCFHHEGPYKGIFIGSLIGKKRDPDRIKQLTKLMNGLRPQALMLHLVQALCRYYSLDLILAVGRQRHVFAGSRREERLGFDYDAFWQEQGGTMLHDDLGIYRLPTSPERRSEAEISSHKRSLYRRRYALLDSVDADLRSRLGAASNMGTYE